MTDRAGGSAASSRSACGRIYCLPGAGGSSTDFRPWTTASPDPSIDVRPIELPGRLRRFAEPAIHRADELAAQLARELVTDLDVSFSLFGHSVGALVAFELARILVHEYGIHPRHLFVSACKAPQYIRARTRLHQLRDADLQREARRLLRPEVVQDPGLLSVVLPALRGDIAVFETYVFHAKPPLACPISAFGGLNDATVTRNDLDGWRIHTTAAFDLHFLPGPHNYWMSSPQALLSHLVRRCSDAA